MKKLVLVIFVLLALGGCVANDKVYNVGKAGYGVGKSVVHITGTENEALRKLDDIAVSYDKTRSTIRNSGSYEELLYKYVTLKDALSKVELGPEHRDLVNKLSELQKSLDELSNPKK